MDRRNCHRVLLCDLKKILDEENETHRLATNLGIAIRTARSLKNENFFQIRQLHNYNHDYEIIQKYFKNSQVQDHLNKYRVNSIELIAIYQVTNLELFKSCDVSRRFLLWHGTREEALKDIIRGGLEITIKNNHHNQRDEGPRGMFGDGIYFADRVTKSMQYVESVTGNGFDEGYHSILLCEVAVGKEWTQWRHNHLLKQAPRGYDSVKGVGRYIPNPEGNLNINRIVVPAGNTILDPTASGELDYNEYVTYQENNARVKYIVSYRVRKSNYSSPSSSSTEPDVFRILQELLN